MRTDNKGRDIFYGVVAIATLIVAMVGATLAYFSVTASSNSGAVNATAAIVSIEYSDGQQVTAQADQLIPSTLDVVKKVYEAKVKDLEYDPENPSTINACLDKNDKQVCSAYRFSVKSDVPRQIFATLNNENNGFTYLAYAVYDVTNGAWLELNDETNEQFITLSACSNLDDAQDNDCHSIDEYGAKRYGSDYTSSIFGYTGSDFKTTIKQVTSVTQTYDLIIFIKENGENQNADQGKEYNGTIVVEVVNSETDGITGEWDD